MKLNTVLTSVDYISEGHGDFPKLPDYDTNFSKNPLVKANGR